MQARIVYTCCFYILAFTLFVVSKPASTFDVNGRQIPFGTGPDETLAPLGIASPALAIASFYMFCILDKILS
jgi:hypothetical protein